MKSIIIKIILRTALVIALLLIGFAAGFPVGQSIGFTTGSEWSLMQADILAREAGMVMPVNFKEGTFRVIVKQPRHLYKRAWKRADTHEEEMVQVNKGKTALAERVQLAQQVYLTQ